MNLPTFLNSRSIMLGGVLLLTGCSCFKSHEESCVYSQYTRGLDETPMVGMAELGILMRVRDGMMKQAKRTVTEELIQKAEKAREDTCSTEEFEKQVEVFNSVLMRRIEGLRKELDVYRGQGCYFPESVEQKQNR